DWDARANGGRIFAPWRPFPHAQLGDIEIGGIDPVRGLINPPEKEIAPICGKLCSFAVALASLGPRLQSHITVETISPTLTKIDLLATNSGYLSTDVSNTGRKQPWHRGLQASLRTSGCKLVSGESVADLGQLPGWGRGADEEGNAPFFQKSRGVEDIALSW